MHLLVIIKKNWREINKIVLMARRENLVGIFLLLVSLCVALSPIEASMASSKKLSFSVLPKGQVPPSGPSPDDPNIPPAARATQNEMLDFGMLPKGDIPPSGPSRGRNIPPPFPPVTQN